MCVVKLATIRNGMWEYFGEVAFAVAVLVNTITEVFVAVVAHMLTFHAYMLARHLRAAFIAPKVTVIIVAISYLLTTFIAIMFGCKAAQCFREYYK